MISSDAFYGDASEAFSLLLGAPVEYVYVYEDVYYYADDYSYKSQGKPSNFKATNSDSNSG
jgi:hypothetical protein